MMGPASVLDVAMLRVMMSEARFPQAQDLSRLAQEVLDAHRELSVQQLLGDPQRFHRTPQAPPLVELRHGWHTIGRYQRVSFPSGFVPYGPPLVRDRWLAYEANKTASAAVLEHGDDPERPWLICIHGLGTGNPWMDFPAFRVERLHRELGINLLLPTLPLHGSRRPAGMMRGSMLSFEVLDTLNAVAQAVWDVRRFLAWLRARGFTRVGLYGLSIGGYTAALVAGLEEVALLLAGIPVCDIPTLFEGHTPPHFSALRDAAEMPEAELSDLFQLISPAQLPPRTAADRRFIYAGIADRITPPDQAEQLWEAWGRPPIEWFQGGHVSNVWSKQVDEFVERVFRDTDFIEGAS